MTTPPSSRTVVNCTLPRNWMKRTKGDRVAVMAILSEE